MTSRSVGDRVAIAWLAYACGTCRQCIGGATGAANDLTGATALATRMTVEFDLSPDLGPVGYSTGQPQFLGAPSDDHPYADETQRAVDLEVRCPLREAQTRALAVLTGHRPALDRLVEQLLEHETVGGDTVVGALSAAMPRERRPARTAGRAPGRGRAAQAR